MSPIITNGTIQYNTLFVNTTDGESQKPELSHGVPQGSALSPTLFNAVMAHLPWRMLSFLNISRMLITCELGFPVRLSLSSSINYNKGMNIIEAFLKERGMNISRVKSAILPFTLEHLKDFSLSTQVQVCQVWVHRFWSTFGPVSRMGSSCIHAGFKSERIVHVLCCTAGTKWGSYTAFLQIWRVVCITCWHAA